MRHASIPVAAATTMFLLGVFIINLQVWYSARADSLAEAHYVVRNMNVILKEARHATEMAMQLAENECDAEGQYRLGTEAALQPHLRTIVILKNDAVWCSSLPGNRVLLVNSSVLPDSSLLLVPSASTVNGLPVLLYQTIHAGSRIIVSISDSHIRDALDMPLNGVEYSLRVGNTLLGLTGDVTTADHTKKEVLTVKASNYPFSVQFNSPPLFSLKRLFNRAGGVVLFLLIISSLSAYILQRYISKDVSPEESLRIAIYRNEIIPYYQPVVSGKEGTLRGVEVLARWKHPQSGFISPASFIPLAEKSGLIIPLTQSLMRQVAIHMNAIATLLPEGFHVGINFSASHIVASTFVEECLHYKRSFTQQDLNLVVEVTEREPLDIDEHLVNTLNELHNNGFAIALDDFGTGYSGLSYLQDLHIDYIKIDQSFVSRVNANEDSTLILDSVLELAKKLSISIVAEGVETEEQLDYLTRNHIRFLQGFFFYKPLPFKELVKVLLSKPKVKVRVE
ncbi:EAL domain-containing protein [Enterobacter asburiae]|uniref:cyclic-guanylate-specific phosphodiesterase n=1 Tax=Enterobacter asburiae TaxID=61645 RepID=A0A8I1KDG8_ENTAS|nr:cyclic diguanylate phosphodiesterase [Enterobacter asburiae]EMB6146795.1 EAL domain-containing protein [Enterobacter asburiae]MBJ6597088.1 EAL domain-containing protein [Enterobacter asburiae]MBK4467560.1 EAL domain-containing protein [Enterobacter asburiae]MBK4575954.1 EAL domain-containing protein [Enterobacter asburiae]HAS1420425.1 EAL domain-containing protein [Enterobacter asburiae]